MKSIFVILVISFCTLVAGAQTVVKMSLPPLPETPLDVVTLFDEGIPLNKTVVLGTMGYKILGGTSPYTFQWFKNDQVVATGNIAVIKPETGASYSLKISDRNNCFKVISINVDASSKVDSETDKQILITPTVVSDHLTISFVDNQPSEAEVSILDSRGVFQLNTSIAGSTQLPLQLPAGSYYVVVRRQQDIVAEKIVVR